MQMTVQVYTLNFFPKSFAVPLSFGSGRTVQRFIFKREKQNGLIQNDNQTV
jgi:hypothetical protein